MLKMQQVSVRVNEHHGDDLIPLKFSDGWKVNLVEMACKGALPMDDGKIRSALENSIGTSNIKEQAGGKKGRIVVTCDDLSRPTTVLQGVPLHRRAAPRGWGL